MEENIDIKEILDALKERWKFIVICTLLAILGCGIVTFFLIKPGYEATTKLFVGKEETTSITKSYDNNEIIMYQKLLKTYSEVIKTKDLAMIAIENTNASMKPDRVLRNLNIVPLADTQIIEVKYKSSSPLEAKEMLDAIANEFIELSRDLVPNGNVKVLEAARIPIYPSSPNKKMNIGIAMLLGLMVGCGIVLLLEFLNNTYKNKDILERQLEIPVIGVIPKLE